MPTEKERNELTRLGEQPETSATPQFQSLLDKVQNLSEKLGESSTESTTDGKVTTETRYKGALEVVLAKTDTAVRTTTDPATKRLVLELRTIIYEALNPKK